MRNFFKVLTAEIGTQLAELGYSYDEALRDGNTMIGFKRDLGGELEAQITFQRHQEDEIPRGSSFTVNLRRFAVNPKARWYTAFDGHLDMRLPEVMWFVYKDRRYGEYWYWWNPLDEAQRQAAFRDALDQLKAYGLPWLEDLNTRMPGVAPEAVRKEFIAAARVATVYDLPDWEEHHPQKAVTGIEVRKQVFGNTWAFIDLAVSARMEERGYSIGVRLHRNEGPEEEWLRPFDFFSTDFSSWLQIEKGLKVSKPIERWIYQDREELDARLREVMAAIKEHAIPALEDPEQMLTPGQKWARDYRDASSSGS